MSAKRLLIGGACAGQSVTVEENQHQIRMILQEPMGFRVPPANPSVTLYEYVEYRLERMVGNGAEHLVFVAAGEDPLVELLANYKPVQETASQTDKWVECSGFWGRTAARLNEELRQARLTNAKLVSALKGVVRVADRATVEFDLAREALAGAEAAIQEYKVAPIGSQRDELLHALRDLETAANSVLYCYYKRPENFAAALEGLRVSAEAARNVEKHFNDQN